MDNLAADDSVLALSPFQEWALAVPEGFDVFLGGGRGGGKSFTLALVALRHAEQYGASARVLYVRQTYKGLADFEAITRDLFGLAYGPGARFNGSEHVWRLPGGAYFELGQLDGPGDYAKYQGRSFSLLLVDEAGQYSTPELIDRLRSNLRAPSGVPIRCVMAANPGDPGHHWLAHRYVFRGTPWAPFLEEKSQRQWVYCPSTFLDNPHIDRASYQAQLEASCPTDPELLRAWLTGDWAVARGAFFSSVIEESRNTVDPWATRLFTRGHAHERCGHALVPTCSQGATWELYLAHDFGVSAPSLTYVCAKSPGVVGPDGHYYPLGSIVLLDELATSVPGNPRQGLHWTVPRLADAIKELAGRWGISPRGVADDAIFARMGSGAGSIAEEFSRYGVHFDPARKADRRTGWEIMRRMLADAGKPDVPGLYISRDCTYFWETVPFLARDPRRPDDVDSRGPDHAADATRYGLLRQRNTWTSVPWRI
jgi:hypothetical protein